MNPSPQQINSEFDFPSFSCGEFDCDLLENPFHAKRFEHLTGYHFSALSINDEAENDSDYSTKKRDILFLLIAIIMAIALNTWFGQWTIFPTQTPSSTTLVVELSPTIQETSPSEETPTSEENPTSIDEKLKSEPEINIEPELPAEQSNENPQQEEISERSEVVSESRLRLIDQVEKTVSDMDLKESVPTIPTEGLQAPGLIFDSRLREKLASPEIERLNRWRAPIETTTSAYAPYAAPVSIGPGFTLDKFGDFCVVTSPAFLSTNSMDIPLYGNGMTIGYYKRVKCDSYFNAPELDRSDVKSSPLRH